MLYKTKHNLVPLFELEKYHYSNSEFNYFHKGRNLTLLECTDILLYLNQEQKIYKGKRIGSVVVYKVIYNNYVGWIEKDKLIEL